MKALAVFALLFNLSAASASALHTDNGAAVNTELKQQISEAISSYHRAQLQHKAGAEWEFLKNIVNIEAFFEKADQAKQEKKERKQGKPTGKITEKTALQHDIMGSLTAKQIFLQLDKQGWDDSESSGEESESSFSGSDSESDRESEFEADHSRQLAYDPCDYERDDRSVRISPGGSEARDLKHKGDFTGNLMCGKKTKGETYSKHISKAAPYHGKNVHGDHSEKDMLRMVSTYDPAFDFEPVHHVSHSKKKHLKKRAYVQEEPTQASGKVMVDNRRSSEYEANPPPQYGITDNTGKHGGPEKSLNIPSIAKPTKTVTHKQHSQPAESWDNEEAHH